MQLNTRTFWSHSAMCGAISRAAKLKATFWNSFCSSFSPMEAVGKAAFTQNWIGAQGRGQQARSPMQRGGQRTFESTPAWSSAARPCEPAPPFGAPKHTS